MIPNADNLRVVLVATRNPLNLGAAARAMSNFGFVRLRVVNPYELAFREARSAVGASEVLLNAEEFGSVAEALGDCSLVVGTTAVRTRELHHPVRRLDEGAELMRDHLARGKVALLFGSEKVGLSNSELNHCHWLMRIPTRDEHISMNLGQAVAVSLYEMARGATVAPQELSAPLGTLQEPASAAEAERLTSVLFEALKLSGYVEERGATATEEKVRRLVRRMEMSGRDAELWLGMLRKMVWKMKSGNW